MEESRSGRKGEWRSGGVKKWRSRGVEEWSVFQSGSSSKSELLHILWSCISLYAYLRIWINVMVCEAD